MANPGYGKRPLWQWVVPYLTVGRIVYSLVYFFFIVKSGYNYSQTNNNQIPSYNYK